MGAGDRSSSRKEKHVEERSRQSGGKSKGTSDKRQSDRTAERKQKSKRITSYSTISETLPPDLGFLWRITPVYLHYTEKDGKRMVGIGDYETSNDSYHAWFPPIRTHCFEALRNGKIYRWRPGGSDYYGSDASKLEEHATASMFYQARQDNLLAVQYDCTKQNVEDEDIGWSSISFKHIEPEQLSAVALEAEPMLAAPAEGTTWMPQVVPQTYSPTTRGPCGRSKPKAPDGGLCGKLPLLIAMAGFSAPEGEAEHAVRHGFLLGRWEPHDREIGIGRYEERGMIVTTWLDPTSPSTTKGLLKSWERGDFGPIWSAHPVGNGIEHWGGRASSGLFSSQQRERVMDDGINNGVYGYEPDSSRAYTENSYLRDIDLPDRSTTPRRTEYVGYNSAGGSSYPSTLDSSGYVGDEQSSSQSYSRQGHASEHADQSDEDDIYSADY